MLGQITEFKEGAGSGPYRIQEYVRRLSLELGLSEVDAELFGRSGRLHDVGKVGVPDSILQKPEQLNADEFNVAKAHSGVGEKILKRSKSMALASVIARSHHERWDGSGYPDGLSGEAIPYAARIVAVVDVFDALISPRPYRAAWSVEQAADEILKGVGSHFDPVVAETFVRLIRRGAFDDLLAAVAEK
jgi:putative two-component system response regulator